MMHTMKNVYGGGYVDLTREKYKMFYLPLAARSALKRSLVRHEPATRPVQVFVDDVQEMDEISIDRRVVVIWIDMFKQIFQTPQARSEYLKHNVETNDWVRCCCCCCCC